MAINLKDTVQIIRGKKIDIAARTGANGELNWADDTYELYIHDGKTRGGHLIGKASGTAGVVGGAGIAVSTSDGISTVSIKRDPSNVLYATTDGAGVRIGTSGALQITAQNALDLRVAKGGGIIVDSSGVKIDSAVLSSVFRYAGQVNSVDDLPSDAQPGDVYDVKDSGANYVWSGTSWDNLGGIMSVDAAPTQGSTNPVASGGVYDAIQDAKLFGDGTTVTVADNTITAKDIAIGGDTGDLASERGFIYDQYAPWYGGSTTAAYAVTDFNEFTTPGVYHIRWREGTPYVDSNDVTWPVTLNNPNAGNGGSRWQDGILEVSQVSSASYTSSWARLQHRLLATPSAAGALGKIFVRAQAVDSSRTWSAWTMSITDADIGDGITVNNGIVSVPEYEGATADTAATSGLVPPAAAGDQNKYFGGDGEWHEIVIPPEVTLSDAVTSDSSMTAASSKAVKTAYDKATEAASAASSAQSTADTAQEAADAAQTTADGKVSKSGDTMTGALVAPRFHVLTNNPILMNLQDTRATLGTAPANELDEQLLFNDKDSNGLGLLQHIMYPDGRNAIMIMTRTQNDNNWAFLSLYQNADRTSVVITSGTQLSFGNGTAIWVE